MRRFDFTIRDFVKENAESYEQVDNLVKTLSNISHKTIYELLYHSKDIGEMGEFVSYALLKYFKGNAQDALIFAQGLVKYLETEVNFKDF